MRLVGNFIGKNLKSNIKTCNDRYIKKSHLENNCLHGYFLLAKFFSNIKNKTNLINTNNFQNFGSIILYRCPNDHNQYNPPKTHNSNDLNPTQHPSLFTKVICFMEIISLIIFPFANCSYATEAKISDAAKEGQSTAKELISDFTENSNWSSRDIEYKGSNTGISNMNSSQVKNVYPEKYFSEQDLRSIDNDENLIKSSDEMSQSLYDDALGDNPSKVGASYKILLDTRKNKAVSNLTDDENLRKLAKKVYDDIDNGSDLLTDCTTILKEVEEAGSIHVSDYQICNRLVDRSSICEIEHELSAEPVIGLLATNNKDHDNSLNIKPCEDDENCFLLFLGQKYSDNGEQCLKYLDELKIAVYHPEAITKVAVSKLGWDDFFGSWIKTSDNVIHPLVLPTSEIPIKIFSELETDNLEAQASIMQNGYAIIDILHNDRLSNDISCENTWHGGKHGENCSGGGRCNNLWDVHYELTYDGISLTKIFKTVEPNDTITVKSITSTADDGMYLIQFKIYYDPSKVIYHDEYTPLDCLNSAKTLDDDLAKGKYQCIAELTNISDGNEFGRFIYSNGQKIFFNNLISPLKNINPECKTISVDAITNYAVDPNSDADNNIDYHQCDDYEKNCGFISSKCIDVGDSGNCYVYEETYDCGYDLDDKKSVIRKSYKCSGDIRCTGSECVDDSYELSDAFAKVSALLEAAQLMAQDMSCSGLDEKGNPTGEEDVICRVFAGTHKTCSQAMKGLGGLEVDCCSSPSGISLSSYICSIRSLTKIDNIIATMDHSSYIYGAYSEIRRPIFNAISEVQNQLSTITKPFTSWLENTTGMKGLFSSDKSITEYITDKLKEKAKDLLRNILGEAQENLATEGVVEGGTSGGVGSYASSDTASAIVENFSSALSVVGYVYMVYQISCMISQMLFKCDAEQLELAAQRSLKNCTYVGQYCSKKVLKHCVQKTYSYCCFSSPLSRIIQEQVKKQQGLSFSYEDPRNPRCEGLLTSDLENIDWSKIDLTEWIELLKITGNYAGDQELNLDNLTGRASSISVDYSDSEIADKERSNVLDRTLSHVMDIDMTKVRQDADKNSIIKIPQN